MCDTVARFCATRVQQNLQKKKVSTCQTQADTYSDEDLKLLPLITTITSYAICSSMCWTRGTCSLHPLIWTMYLWFGQYQAAVLATERDTERERERGNRKHNLYISTSHYSIITYIYNRLKIDNLTLVTRQQPNHICIYRCTSISTHKDKHFWVEDCSLLASGATGERGREKECV